MAFMKRVGMKVTKRQLPSTVKAAAAIVHLYRVWSVQGRVQMRRIVRRNPNMVNALRGLWQQDHQRASGAPCDEDPSGVLTGIGSWRLLLEQDGSGVIVIDHEA